MARLDVGGLEPALPVVAPGLGGLTTLLRPPDGLLARVRWIFLLASLALATLFGITGTLASAGAGLPWPVVVVATLALAATWIYGYQQQRFTLVTDLVCVAALLALSASLPDQRFLQYAPNAAIWMRALHSTLRQGAFGSALFVLAFAGGVLLSPGGMPAEGAIIIGRTVLVGAAFTAVFSLVASVLRTYQRAIEREQRLRVAGHALAEASTRAEIYGAALVGSRGLLAGTGEYGVELAVGAEEDMEVVAAAGEGADVVHGMRLHARDLPGMLRTALHEGRPFEVVHAEPALFAALDFAPRHGSGSIYGVPLVSHGRFEGALIVASHDPLDDELKDDLQTLGDLTALAVESQILLESRASGGATALPAAASVAALPFDRARAATRAAASAVGSAAASSGALWRMPHDLPQRIRWLFLVGLLGVATWVGLVSLVTAAGGVFSPLQLVPILAPVWLGAWWIYGYRRGDFPLAGDVVIGALLTLMLYAADSFLAVQPVLFASLWMRAPYGTTRRVAVAAGIHVVALLVAIALSPGRGVGLIEPPQRLLLPVVMLVVAGAVHLLALTMRRYERALARERSLRIAGHLLVIATDRAHVQDATLEGAAALLAGTAGATAMVALDALPERFVGLLAAGEPAELTGADAGAWQTLGQSGAPAAVYAAPLHARGVLEGAIVVGSDAPLDGELKDDLQTLASLAALSLEDVVLAGSEA